MFDVNHWDCLTFCDLVGGPLDGSRMQVSMSKRLIRIPVIERFGPDGTYANAQESPRWVHGYVRLGDDVFEYDGIRER